MRGLVLVAGDLGLLDRNGEEIALDSVEAI